MASSFPNSLWLLQPETTAKIQSALELHKRNKKATRFPAKGRKERYEKDVNDSSVKH